MIRPLRQSRKSIDNLNPIVMPLSPEAFFILPTFNMEVDMTHQEFYKNLAAKTGDELTTIKRIGFELHVTSCDFDRKEQKRLRRLKHWRQQRRDRYLANIAAKVQS